MFALQEFSPSSHHKHCGARMSRPDFGHTAICNALPTMANIGWPLRHSARSCQSKPLAPLCNFIVLSRNEPLHSSIVVHPAKRAYDMEVTPRPKRLVTAIAIGLGGIGLAIVLSMIK